MSVSTANPDFSSLVDCVAANIRPGCVTLCRPPRRAARVRLRGPRSQALPGWPLRRLATTSDEKSGLTGSISPGSQIADSDPGESHVLLVDRVNDVEVIPPDSGSRVLPAWELVLSWKPHGGVLSAHDERVIEANAVPAQRDRQGNAPSNEVVDRARTLIGVVDDEGGPIG